MQHMATSSYNYSPLALTNALVPTAGPLKNRTRLLVEICHAIRARVAPSFILSLKLNSTDFQDDGFKPEDARELVSVLQEEVRLDFVELSGGKYELLGLEWTKGVRARERRFYLSSQR
jgi:2,4-dienoyl-CoA reductase-like NADH-dependent reductase (Old Yellow Enzyme family)